MNRRGAGVIQVVIGLAIVSLVSALSFELLKSANTQAALNRKNGLVKKSFSAAEQVLISQRQCRCNLRGATFKYSGGAVGQVIEFSQIKTFEDEDTCLVNLNDDQILSTTKVARSDPLYASEIKLFNFKEVIPEMLYRATLSITPSWGAPVSFPLLLNTESDGAGRATIEICGVDRAS